MNAELKVWHVISDAYLYSSTLTAENSSEISSHLMNRHAMMLRYNLTYPSQRSYLFTAGQIAVIVSALQIFHILSYTEEKRNALKDT